MHSCMRLLVFRHGCPELLLIRARHLGNLRTILVELESGHGLDPAGGGRLLHSARAA